MNVEILQIQRESYKVQKKAISTLRSLLIILKTSKMNITAKEKKQIQEIKQLAKISDPKNDKSVWETLITGIVRPPRADYRDTQLGTKNFTYNQVLFTRLEQTVLHEGKKIDLTILQPQDSNGWIVLYLHGNSSSKLQAISLLKYLPKHFSLGCFDFIGCGKNKQQDNVTLGSRQSKEVASIVDHLEKEKYRVVVWGRSMGAASALKYGKAQVIVADSSFKCLKSLCKQVAKNHSPGYVPPCLIACLFPCVFFKLKQDVRKKANYDVQQLDIKDAVKNIDTNSLVIFMSGDKDTLIHHRNSKKLYDAFPGKNKKLQIFEGTHNTKRPEEVMKRVMGYILEYSQTHKELIPRISSKSKTELDEYIDAQRIDCKNIIEKRNQP